MSESGIQTEEEAANLVLRNVAEIAQQQQARDLGAGLALQVFRLLKIAQFHALDNMAVLQQIDQTVDALRGFGAQTGEPLTMLFAKGTVFVAGHLFKASRGEYENALELGRMVKRLGVSEIRIDNDADRQDLTALARLFQPGARIDLEDGVIEPSPRIRLRYVNPARLGEGEEELSEEEQVLRTYATSVVVMRRVFENLNAGRYQLPHQAKRLAQRLVMLSEGDTPAFLGVTAMRNLNHDAAGRAVNRAILAVSMARQLTEDLAALARIAMSALFFDVAHPLVTGIVGRANEVVVGYMSEEGEQRLPAATALVMTALGQLRQASIVRSVVAYEAQWLRNIDTLGPIYGGARRPMVAARVVVTAHRFNQLLEPDLAAARNVTPDDAIMTMRGEARDATDRAMLALLIGAVGIFPRGTAITLNTGEVAVVVRTPSHPADYPRPTVRLVCDAHGQPLRARVAVDLTQDLERQVASVITNPDATTQQVMRAVLESQTSLPPPQSARPARPPAPAAQPPPPPSRPRPEEVSPRSSRAPVHSAPTVIAEVPAEVRRAASAFQRPTPREPLSAPGSDRTRPSLTGHEIAIDPNPSGPSLPGFESTGHDSPSRSVRPEVRSVAVDAPPVSRPRVDLPGPSSPTLVSDPSGVERRLPAPPPQPFVSHGPATSSAPGSQRTPPPVPRRKLPASVAPPGHLQPYEEVVVDVHEISEVEPSAPSAHWRRPPAAIPPSQRQPARDGAVDGGLAPSASGSLERTPFSHLLLYLLDRALTGTLMFTEPKERDEELPVEHAAYFQDGIPTKVHAAARIAPLGSMLVAFGVLDQDVLESEPISQPPTHEATLETELMESSLVRRDQIAEVRNEQLLERVSFLFSLPPGTKYAFYNGLDLLEAIWGNIPGVISPLGALTRGLREHPEEDAMDRVLTRLGGYLLHMHPDADLDSFEFDAEERAVAEVIGASMAPLPDLVEAGHHPDTIRRVVYELMITRCIAPMASSPQSFGPATEPSSVRPASESVPERGRSKA